MYTVFFQFAYQAVMWKFLEKEQDINFLSSCLLCKTNNVSEAGE